jgi:hypothetical protein
MAKEKGKTFDGITRPSNDLYRKRFDEIFKKVKIRNDESKKMFKKEKTVSELLREGYEEEKRMYEEE